MTTHTVELFETIILHPKDFPGQRNALAFFGAGAQGIHAARRVAKMLKAENTVENPIYLGGAQVEQISAVERNFSTKEGWENESAAKLAAGEWFRTNFGSIAFAVDGDPKERIDRTVIFATDKDFSARGCVRIIAEHMHYFCKRVTKLVAFDGTPEEQDWLAREMLSSVVGAVLWPTARFLYGVEPLLEHKALAFAEINQKDLANFLAVELSAIQRGMAA
jgi:hypothetical protein